VAAYLQCFSTSRMAPSVNRIDPIHLHAWHLDLRVSSSFAHLPIQCACTGLPDHARYSTSVVICMQSPILNTATLGDNMQATVYMYIASSAQSEVK